jgi:hypothetical protein
MRWGEIGESHFEVLENSVDCEFESRSGKKKDYKIGSWSEINANSAILHLYHGETKLIFNNMMIRSALY